VPTLRAWSSVALTSAAPMPRRRRRQPGRQIGPGIGVGLDAHEQAQAGGLAVAFGEEADLVAVLPPQEIEQRGAGALERIAAIGEERVIAPAGGELRRWCVRLQPADRQAHPAPSGWSWAR
jgi:hypothetical protein